MRKLTVLLLGALAVGSAFGQSTATNPASDASANAAQPSQPAGPAGIIILHAVAGYDAANITFTSIQWVNNDGGYVVDAAGTKTAFLNTSVARIIYFDQAYYDEVDHNAYWVDWRAGIQSREVVAQPLETTHLEQRDLVWLQKELATLQEIAQRYPSGQPAVQPMIDGLKDDCDKLNGGQILQNGQWIAANAASTAATPTPVVGEGNQPVTFTTKDGRKFTNATIVVNSTSVSVLTSDGGAAVEFEQMPDDLSGFPPNAKAKIKAEQDRIKVAKAQETPAATGAASASSTAAAAPPPTGIWAQIEYYAGMIRDKVVGLFSSSTATTSTTTSKTTTATPAIATAAAPAAPAPAPPVPAGPGPLSVNAVVIIKGDFAEGTGFFTHVKGVPVVITNLHVIAANPNFKILTSSGKEVEMTDMKGASDRDLAMFTIVDRGYTYLTLDTDVEQNAAVGDATVIPGNSEGGEVTLKTNGKVVGIGPQQVEFNNPVYHGNSGGPVFDNKTNTVIAVVTQAMRMDPKNDIDRSSFANANSAIKGPMRYFGYRLDTVPSWQEYDPNLFLSETLFLKQFHELSRALDSFMNGAGYGTAASSEEGPPNATEFRSNPRVLKAAMNYQNTLRTHDKLTAIQQLVWDVGTLVDEDFDSVSDIRRFYPYDQDRAKFEVAYRKALKEEVERARDYLNNARSSAEKTPGL